MKKVRTAQKLNIIFFLKEIRRNFLLYTMMLPGIVWLFIFSYIPMAGITLAFKEYDYSLGILESPWNGFYNFQFIFLGQNLGSVTFNTIYLNLLFIVTGTFASVFLAILFSEIQNKYFKKISQSIVILPHFISWAIVAAFLGGFISDKGIVNQFLTSAGAEKIDFYSNPAYWPWLLVILRIWQGAGFGTIVYIAAITGMDREIYEAAQIDGANRFQLIQKITLPLLKNTIVLLTIMSIGNIFRGDFGMIYALVGDNSILYPTTDVIDTYVYRALRANSNLGFSTAASFYQSTVGFVMVMLSNWVVKKFNPESALF